MLLLVCKYVNHLLSTIFCIDLWYCVVVVLYGTVLDLMHQPHPLEYFICQLEVKAFYDYYYWFTDWS